MSRWAIPKWSQVSTALLVLTLTAAALSFRYRGAAYWTARSKRANWSVALVLGRVVVIHQRDDIPDQLFPVSGWLFEFGRIPAFNEISDAASDDPARIHFRFAGIMHLDGNAPDFFSDSIYVPLWLPALAFAFLPAVAACRWLRARRRIIGGRCPRCGYDLRASAARCPECGALIKTESAIRREGRSGGA